MKISFVSRADMKKMIESGSIDTAKDVVISVSDTHKEQHEIVKLLMNSYDDFVTDITGPFLCQFFSDDEESFKDPHANFILKFINYHGTKKNYIVHCFAGISRSGAIAKFINEYFEAGIFYLEDYKGYNRHVFDTLHKAAGTSLSAYYEELEKQDRKYGWEKLQMKQITCKTYYTAKEKAKEAIDKGYTDIQILLDRDIWYVFYCDYLELDDVY